jgi:AcrR family transcriptional regulator
MTDQSVSDRKRTSILEAARTVFSRKAYADAAVDDVAEHAHIAKGTLYLYFKSKEDLYLAALVSDLRAMSADARGKMESASGFREKLRAFFAVRLDYCRSHENFLRIYLAEYGTMFLRAPLNRELHQLVRENIRYVAQVVEEAIGSGEIRPVPAQATAAAIFDMSRGLIERRLLGWKEFRAKDEIEFSIDLLCSGIGNNNKTAARGRARRA